MSGFVWSLSWATRTTRARSSVVVGWSPDCAGHESVSLMPWFDQMARQLRQRRAYPFESTFGALIAFCWRGAPTCHTEPSSAITARASGTSDSPSTVFHP